MLEAGTQNVNRRLRRISQNLLRTFLTLWRNRRKGTDAASVAPRPAERAGCLDIRMNRFVHIVVWAAALAVASVAHAGEAKRILCFGDSITDKGTWVATVGKLSPFETVNAGQSGRKAAQAKESLAGYLAKYPDCDKIIMFLGVNDLPARDTRPGDVKVAACVKNMSDAIDLALKAFKPKDIILIAPCNVNPDTMNATNRKKGYDVVPPLLEKLAVEYEALARRKGTSFLSLLNVVSKDNYRDGLHPNEAGDAEIAKAILDFLAKPQRSERPH